MDALVYILRDIFVFLFEYTLEPLGNIPNGIFLILLVVGLFVWLKMQSKFNKEADNQPHSLTYNSADEGKPYQIK